RRRPELSAARDRRRRAADLFPLAVLAQDRGREGRGQGGVNQNENGGRKAAENVLSISSCPAFVPGIHVFGSVLQKRRGWPGRCPAMTKFKYLLRCDNHDLDEIVGIGEVCLDGRAGRRVAG